MNSIYKAVFVLVTCLFFSFQGHASHIMGADITYEYRGTNASGQSLYFVRLSFYRLCCTSVCCATCLPNDVLTVTDSCTGTTRSFSMNQDSCINGCEVVSLCAGELTTCQSAGSLFPGINKFIDTATIALPTACANWTVSWTDGSRNATITNLQNPSGQNIYIQATINNNINPGTGLPYATNSVYFTKNPVPFACLSNASGVTYSNGAVAPNGDSLVYTLINPLTGQNLPIAHTAGYTSTQPITSNPPVTFNSATGIMGFNPTQLEVDVITFLVQQYVNGILVSSVMRDVQLTVVNCNQVLPAPPVAGIPIDLVNADTSRGAIKVCPGTATSFDIVFKDPNGRNVSLTSDITGSPSALPGATFTQVGTGDSVLAHITWTPTPADTGCHPFEVNIATDDCPIPGTSVVSYTLCVLTKVTVTPHNAIYCGTPIHLVATGGANATWTPTTGLSFPNGIYEPLAAPATNTLYTFTSDCGSDTSLIVYNPPFSMSAGPGGTICQNNYIQLNATLDNLYAPYSIQWIPATGLTNPITHTPDDTILDPIASPAQTTTYTYQVTANTGCIRTDTVTVRVNGQAPAISAHALPDTVCPGHQVKLWTTLDPACGLATTVCMGPPNIVQVGMGSSVTNGTNSTYPSPYGDFYKSARHQFLIHANELYSLVGSGGQITSFAMNIGVLNGGSTLNQFTIRMGCVSMDSLTGYVNESLLSTVYQHNYTPVNGWNTHILTTPYNWDGQSDLVVDVCFSGAPGGSINNRMVYTTTPYRSVWCTYSNDVLGECGYSGRQQGVAATYASCFQRPDFRFNVCITPLNDANITWTPNTGPNGVTLAHMDTTYAYPVHQTTYYVTYADPSGCSSRDYVTVYVDTTVQLILAPDTFICSPTQIPLKAQVPVVAGSGINPDSILYTWSARPSSAQVPVSGKGSGFSTAIVTVTDTTTYICQISGPGFCTITDSIHVILGNNLPVSALVDSITCSDSSNGKIYINMSAGTPPYRYVWSPAAGAADSITGLAPGTFYVTVTDAGGCVGHDIFKLTLPTAIAMRIDSTPITCFNAANGKLSDSAWGGRGPYNITWTPGGANPLSGLSPGMYIVHVTDAKGCPAADTAYLGQPIAVTASIISTDSVSCYGGSNGYANVLAGGGRPPYHYRWSGSSSVDSFANDLSAGVHSVTVTDAHGCIAIDTFTIYIPAQIAITAIDTTAAHCATSHDGSTVVTVIGGTPPYNYVFDLIPSLLDSAGGLTAGPHMVEVIDSKGCLTGDVNFTIDTQYVLHIGLTTDSVSCNGGSNGLAFVSQVNGTPTYTYQWNPSSSITDSAAGLSAGTQNVIVTDSYGCTATGGITVGQPNNPEYEWATRPPLCTGQHNGEFWLAFVNTLPPGQAGPLTYTFDGVTYAITDTVFNIPAGTDTVVLTYNGHGCTTTFTVTLTDPQPLTVPAPTVTGISCANEADGIIQVIPAGGTQPYSYSWSPGGYTTAAADSLGPATYDITVTDANGCTVSATQVLIAPPLITDSLIADSASCPGSSDGRIIVEAAGGTPGTLIPYTYSINGGSYQIGNNFFSLTAGTYQINVMDSPGCVLNSSVTVYQPSAVTVYINPQDSLIPLGSSIQIFSIINNLTTQTVNSYTWSPALGLNCIDCPNPVASPYQNTQYYLVVNYGKGCNAIDSNIIYVSGGPPVYIPNAFSPNGDNVNDYFSVYGTTLQSVGMTVFNRWGEKVFDSGTSQWASWDGTYKSVLQPPGVYVYYVRLVYLNGTQETKEGSVTLIR